MAVRRRNSGVGRDAARRMRARAARDDAPVEDEDPQPKPLMERIADGLGRLRSVTISFVTVATPVLVTVFLVLELWRDTVQIEPIQIPPELADHGYTPEIVANRLVAQMRRVHAESKTRRDVPVWQPGGAEGDAGGAMLPDWGAIDIEVPGTGLTVGTVISVVRGILQRLELPFGGHTVRISGEIVGRSPDFRLDLRVTGRSFGNHSGLVSLESAPHVDEAADASAVVAARTEGLLRDGARELLAATSPYLLAVRHYQDDPETAIELIKSALSDDATHNDHWALNLWGLILHRQHLDAVAELAGADERLAEIRKEQQNARINWMKADAAFKRLEAKLAQLEQDGEADAGAGDVLVLMTKRAQLEEEATSLQERFLEVEEESKRLEVDIEAAKPVLRNDADRFRDGAVTLYEEALQLAPEFAIAHANRGVTLARHAMVTGDSLEEAIAAFERAAALDPDRASIFSQWGLVLQVSGRLKAAVETYEKAVGLEPLDPANHVRLGIARFQLGRRQNNVVLVEQALGSYRRALLIDEAFAAAWRHLGIAQCAANALGEAEVAWRRAVDADPDGREGARAAAHLTDLAQKKPCPDYS